MKKTANEEPSKKLWNVFVEQIAESQFGFGIY